MHTVNICVYLQFLKAILSGIQLEQDDEYRGHLIKSNKIYFIF